MKHEIKNINLANLVERYGVKLKRAGARFVGLCPFHDEKTASFYVFDDNHFKCFGCGKHGDAADFIMEMDGCDFKEALRLLGIEDRPAPAVVRQQQHKQDLVSKYKQWEISYHWLMVELRDLVELAISKITTPEQMDNYAELFHWKSRLENHIHAMVYGADREKFELYQTERMF